MLRTSTATVGTLRRLPQLVIRQQSTAAQVQAAPAKEEQRSEAPAPKAPLSARLRGAGRGVPELQVTDPLQKFIKDAESRKIPTGSKSNNKKFAPGQFDDAPEEGKKNVEAAPRSQQNNNRRFQPRQRQQQQRQRQQDAQAGQQQASGNKRTPRERQRRPSLSSSSSSRAAANQPVRRVTTFIDQDIDWSLMSSLEESTTIATEGQTSASSEAVPEVQSGEYQRYFTISNDLQWAPAVNTEALSVLVGSNASYNMEQKVAFMNAVSNATKGATAAAAK